MGNSMKTSILNLIIQAWQNKHTSLAGIVYVICKLGAIWLPKYNAQFQATEAVAVGWGLLKAGDAKAATNVNTINPEGVTGPKP